MQVIIIFIGLFVAAGTALSDFPRDQPKILHPLIAVLLGLVAMFFATLVIAAIWVIGKDVGLWV